MNKSIIISIIVSVGLIFGAMYLTSDSAIGDSSTVSIKDGTQIIDLRAYNGYSPRVIAAKAGMPTTLRVTTSDTRDCSASLTIPKIGYKKILATSGSEDIPITPEQAQGTLNGVCSMGMKSFKVQFN